MSNQEPMKGNCLCGAVEIVANEVTTEVTACHCGMCRRWGGGPYMEIPCFDVNFNGSEFIEIYDSSKWAERGFCKKCGTHLFYHIKNSDEYQLQVGIFGEAIDPQFKTQVFIDRKPGFYSFSNKTEELTEAQIIEMYAPKE